MIAFEWDNRKANTNLKNHAVSFDEAKSVFFDDYAIQYFDEDHSGDKEERYLMLRMSNFSRILLVVHYFRAGDNVIRIIPARKATKKEQSEYQGPSL